MSGGYLGLWGTGDDLSFAHHCEHCPSSLCDASVGGAEPRCPEPSFEMTLDTDLQIGHGPAQAIQVQALIHANQQSTTHHEAVEPELPRSGSEERAACHVL
jgi:hypothetical protein